MRAIFVAIILIVMSPFSAFALPAFPGAEGMGAATVGGRDGTVYIVDTLSDDPADGVTLREALTASGARYIVFAVSGIIDLATDISVYNPYFTLAGQTSPSGITIVGAQVRVYTHDAIITHMRFRSGEYRCAEGEGDYRRSFEITGCGYMENPACSGTNDIEAYNIIMDHCSFSWGPDNVAGTNGNVQDITFSWCQIAYGSQNGCHQESNHNLGFFVWGKGNDATLANRAMVSLHHSFIGYNRYRIPENNQLSFLDNVNNVSYYYETVNTNTAAPDATYGVATTNIIGSYMRPGPTGRTEGGTDVGTPVKSLSLGEMNSPCNPAYMTAAIYMYGCLDGFRDEQSDPQWSTQCYWHTDEPLSTSWQRATPWPTTGYSGNGIAVTATTMDSTYAASVVANAGASKCQSGNCRDGVDTLAISEYNSNDGHWVTGTSVDTLAEVTALINYGSPASAATDSDSDGMADAWETTYGTNPAVNDATGDLDSDGYNNIEEYLHVLAGYAAEGSAGVSGVCTGNFSGVLK